MNTPLRNPFGEDGLGRELGNFFSFTPFKLFGDMSVPNVDIYQTPVDVIIKAEIPGVSKQDLDLNIDDTSVRISGKTKRDSQFTEENAYRTEMYYGSFSRTVPLPVRVKSELARADYKDGILSVTVPKAEPPKPQGKKIDIE